MSPSARYAGIRHVLLDRDGVLCREPATGWIARPEDFRWEDGSLAALRVFAHLGLRVSVVSNQSCIGRGVHTFAAVERVNAQMVQESGGAIHAVFVCPHAPEDACACRKPRPGLLLQAIAASGVAPEHTIMVGDAPRDLEAGRAAFVRVALVRTGKGMTSQRDRAAREVPVFENLLAFASLLRDGAAFGLPLSSPKT